MRVRDESRENEGENETNLIDKYELRPVGGHRELPVAYESFFDDGDGFSEDVYALCESQTIECRPL